MMDQGTVGNWTKNKDWNGMEQVLLIKYQSPFSCPRICFLKLPGSGSILPHSKDLLT